MHWKFNNTKCNDSCKHKTFTSGTILTINYSLNHHDLLGKNAPWTQFYIPHVSEEDKLSPIVCPSFLFWDELIHIMDFTDSLHWTKNRVYSKSAQWLSQQRVAFFSHHQFVSLAYERTVVNKQKGKLENWFLFYFPFIWYVLFFVTTMA